MKPWLAPLLFATSLLGQPPQVRLPDEAAGLDGIARTLISAFDQADIVALGEGYGRKPDSDLRIAVVRHPDFAKKVSSIAVELAALRSSRPLTVTFEAACRTSESRGCWRSIIPVELSW
jgi:hypothetical protein